MSNELDKIEKRIEAEERLKIYAGADRVVHAEDKRKELEELKKTRPKFAAMTGIEALDSCLDGFRKGWVVVVSGPPKQGKTLFCQGLTKKFADQNLKSLWFSYELGYEELFEKFPMDKLEFYVPNHLASGNLKARTRMCTLYYHANLMNRMVIGTGNRTELLLGYFTKYGDGGVDIEPIGGLYKTQVRGLSRHMKVPSHILDKTPTAGLWPGQTDEKELGVTYEEADRILSMLIDEKMDGALVSKAFPRDHVDRLVARLHANEHKRVPPKACDI